MDQTSFSLLVGWLVGAPLGAVVLNRLTGWSLWLTYPTGGLVGLILFAVVAFVAIELVGQLLRRFRMSAKPNWRPVAIPFDLAAPEPVAVVHFWASWNGHDREMEARLNKLSDVFDSSFPLRTCDCDEPTNRLLVSEANIATIPTLVLVVRGVPQEGRQIVGLRSVNQLRSQLVEWRDANRGGPT